ncbi:MAG: hypothetical protein IJJ26_04535 [Victivallales bacterium]|nr:hypothetical protein [Victivallales bacterium]
MADKDKKNVELLLESVNIGVLSDNSASRRIITLEMVWPRWGIASKTSAKVLEFGKDGAATLEPNWYQRIILKDSVEGHFGMVVKVTENATETKIRNFLRYFIGTVIGNVGDIMTDAGPKKWDDTVDAPAEYAKKNLRTTVDAQIEAQGGLDLTAASLEDGLLTIPLLACENHYVYKKTVMRSKGGPTTRRECDAAKGSKIGSVSFRVALL